MMKKFSRYFNVSAGNVQSVANIAPLVRFFTPPRYLEAPERDRGAGAPQMAARGTIARMQHTPRGPSND